MAQQSVEIAKGLTLPAGEFATQTTGIIASKGGGKSYLASKAVEGLYDAAVPFVVLDPVGTWHALTLGADGKSPGLGVVVIGGDRGDVGLDEEQSEAVGALLVLEGLQAVIDLSELSKAKRKTYVAALCEAIYRTARKHRRPFTVVFEEAQLFAPQHAGRGEERMLGAVTDIVRLGRNYGLGCILITQRPQSVSKEVLNQTECLFVGQLRGPQERKAIAGWIIEQGADSAKASLDELPALPVGEFYCWSPSWLRVFRRVKVLPKRTYDGSSTPKLGAAPAQLSKAARAVDEVVAKLQSLGAGSSADSLARIESATDALSDKALEAIEGEKVARIRVANVEHENAALWDQVKRFQETVKSARELLGSALRHLDSLGELANVTAAVAMDADSAPRHLDAPLVDGPAKASRKAARVLQVPHTPGLDKPEAAILRVLAWQPKPISKARLALLAGYAAKGGGFNNALGRLRGRELIDGRADLFITNAGRKAIGPVPQPPTGAQLFDWWMAHPRMDKPMRAILEAMGRALGPMPVDSLAESAGYTPGTGGFSNALGRLRTLGLVEGGRREPIRLAADLQRKRGRAA